MKWVFLSISLCSVLIAIGLMWQHAEHHQDNIQQSPNTMAATQEATTAVEQPWMVERKGNHTLWRIKAKKAEQGLQTMHLTQPYLELFNDAGEKITIIGQEGDVHMLSRDVFFNRKVRVHYQHWVLDCDHLRYQNKTGDIVVTGRFVAQKPNTHIQGRGLRVHQNTHIMQILHDVSITDSSEHTSGDIP